MVGRPLRPASAAFFSPGVPPFIRKTDLNSNELWTRRLLTSSYYGRSPPEKIKIMGPAEASTLRLKTEFRYQILIKAASRKALNELLRDAQRFAQANKWPATSLVIDVDPLTLM